MGEGYRSKPQGADYVADRIKNLERRQASAGGSAPMRSAVVGAGGVTVTEGGSVVIQGGGDLRVRDGGRMTADYPGGERGVQFGPVYFERDTGRPPDGHGILIEAEDGTDIFRAAQMADGTVQSMLAGGGLALWAMDGDFQIFGLPTSTQAGNLRLQADSSGAPRIYLGSSSNKALKPDLCPLDAVSPDDVLAIEPQTWTDGDDQVIGVTVEQVQAIGSVAPLLIRPAYPDGESVEYDRISILHQVVLRAQDERITELEDKLARQGRLIAALCEHVGIDPEEVA